MLEKRLYLHAEEYAGLTDGLFRSHEDAFAEAEGIDLSATVTAPFAVDYDISAEYRIESTEPLAP